MEFLNQILHFDSSMWILQALDNHWLLVNLIWGSFMIYAKRSDATWDDAFVDLIKGLNPAKRLPKMKLFKKENDNE